VIPARKWSFIVPYTHKNTLVLLLAASTLGLTACGAAKQTPEEVLAKAEAAATRAETAQKAAEEAAEVARGKYRQIAQAESSASGDTSTDEPSFNQTSPEMQPQSDGNTDVSNNEGSSPSPD
jgi:hypothetical protein